MRTPLLAALGCAALVTTLAFAFPPDGAKPASGTAAPPARPAAGANPHVAGAHGLPAMPPGKQAPGSPQMPITASGADRIVWSCNFATLGSLPIMVNFKDSTALSTRGSKISKAAIAGNMVRWQENKKDGVYAFALNRQTRAVQVAVTDLKGKVATYEGNCGAPDPNRKPGKAAH